MVGMKQVSLANRDSLYERDIQRLLDSTGSTTFFLEQLAGRRINVVVILQKILEEHGVAQLYRESLLYCITSDSPILFSVCLLDLEAFLPQELEQLWAGSRPLGKIVDPDNAGQLRKVNSSWDSRFDPHLSGKLKTNTMLCYTRHYDLFVSDRRVGKISEGFNEGSIARAYF